MPFIPHTETEIRDMLAAIGVDSIERLFDEIPANLRAKSLGNLPEGMNEMAINRLMQSRAAQDGAPVCFIGAGSYEHHIPAAVWQIATRGEYYTAYTPYQAEASQGTLQLIYEYQSMMTALTGMDVSNASLYDGASALSEAVLMAVRAHRKSKSRRVLVPRNVNPFYRKATHGIVKLQDIELQAVDYDSKSGQTPVSALQKFAGQDFAALVISQPTFFGTLEQVDELTDWAHANNMLVIAVVNPTSLALLKPPGEWGATGADIVCGDGQPLGAPMSSGGPYYGFMCCKKEFVRQMPGRIVGRTVDLDGKTGYALTLQAREQHIRRSKATSNICTNQGLVVTASTIYMSLLGPDGLANVASASHQNTAELIMQLTAIKGVKVMFNAAHFHEAVISLPKPAAEVLAALAGKNILGGYDLGKDYPELGNALLVCATEMRTAEDIAAYANALKTIL
jgi:glycine dehydrogenase subunit 1